MYGEHLSYGMAKHHKISLDQRIWLLVHRIKQYDKPFSILNENDKDESIQRINFFLSDVQNLKMLDDYNFKLLLNQVENFYKINQPESLVDWNYRVHIVNDYIKEETVSKIEKIEEDLNDSFIYQTSYNNKFSTECNEESNFPMQNKDEIIFSNKNDFCDVTLACEDSLISTRKLIISSTSPEQIYSNLLEEILKESCEEVSDDILRKFKEYSESLYENISEEIFEELCNETSANIFDEIEAYSKIIYESLSGEIISEISEEIHFQVMEEISFKMSEELCNEVSTYCCQELIFEIMTELQNYSQHLFENIFEELANEIYDEIYFSIQQKHEKQFSITFPIKQENDEEINLSSQKLILDEHEISVEFDDPLIDRNLSPHKNKEIFIENPLKFPSVSIQQELRDIQNLITFSCNICYKVFDINRRLEQHVKTIHAKNSLNSSATKFKDDTCFNQIIRTANKLKNDCGTVYPCGNCKINSTCNCTFKRQNLSNHKSRVYTCDQCSFKFNNKKSLESHVGTTHDFSYTCDLCDSIFPLKNELKYHNKVNHRSLIDQYLQKKYNFKLNKGDDKLKHLQEKNWKTRKKKNKKKELVGI